MLSAKADALACREMRAVEDHPRPDAEWIARLGEQRRKEEKLGVGLAQEVAKTRHQLALGDEERRELGAPECVVDDVPRHEREGFGHLAHGLAGGAPASLDAADVRRSVRGETGCGCERHRAPGKDPERSPTRARRRQPRSHGEATCARPIRSLRG